MPFTIAHTITAPGRSIGALAAALVSLLVSCAAVSRLRSSGIGPG
jgi:hypothetical protein